MGKGGNLAVVSTKLSKLSRSSLLELSASIYGLIVQGLDDREIMIKLGISNEMLEMAKKKMYEIHTDRLRTRTNDEVYIDYVAAQKRNIRDLNFLIKNLDEKSQYNALVGAIRLRSEIQDKIIYQGQELGIIKKQATRHEVVGKHLVVNMTSDQLRNEIQNLSQMMANTVSKFGDGNFMSIPIDLTRRPEALPAPVETTGTVVRFDHEEDDEEQLEAALKEKEAKSKKKKKAKKK